MDISQDTHKKMLSAYNLLAQDAISLSSFGHISTLLKGIHPDIDEKLAICEKAVSNLQKVLDGDMVTLSVEHLPEKDEKQKKRKKLLLFFINSLKDLQSEIQRITAEFSNSSSPSQNIWHAGKIIKFAKGPFGIVTGIALVIVGISLFFHPQKNLTSQPKNPATRTIQVIIFQQKQIPLNQLYVGTGSDCDSPHYHATTGVVTALDGTKITDPEGCGFGKLKDTQVLTVQE